VRLITRGGYDWTKRYPWIAESALKNRIRQFVLDGEAVVLGEPPLVTNFRTRIFPLVRPRH
jgi:ATP-dependent DNA ligase